MSARVIWSEGTFIRPQHFQQQERFLLQQLDNRTKDQFPFGYGFSHLAISLPDLDFGRVSITACSGVFQDGTTFNAPEYDKELPSIAIDGNVRDAIVYLAIPKKNNYTAEVTQSANKDETGSLTRYVAQEQNVTDVSVFDGRKEQVHVGQLNLRLFIDSANSQDESQQVPQGYLTLAVAHIREVRSGRIQLNESFIPTVISFSQSQVLVDFVNDLHSMVSARADELAVLASGEAGKGGVAEVADFMQLQMLNRFSPLLHHYGSLEGLHPLFLYQFLLSFAGELATFMRQNKRPPIYPEYQHDIPINSFATLMDDIKKSFNVVLVQNKHFIELSPPNERNVRAARIFDSSIYDACYFVLAVSAQVPDETIRTNFPSQIKIAPGEKIYSLMGSIVPGIEIAALPVAPREIPYNAGFTYFELKSDNELWQELKNSQGLALHISGDFPGLELQLWAINRR